MVNSSRKNELRCRRRPHASERRVTSLILLLLLCAAARSSSSDWFASAADSSSTSGTEEHQGSIRKSLRRLQGPVDPDVQILDTILLVDLVPNTSEKGISKKDVTQLEHALIEAYSDCPGSYSLTSVKVDTAGHRCSYAGKNFKRFIGRNDVECLYGTNNNNNLTWLVQVQASLNTSSSGVATSLLSQEDDSTNRSVACPRLFTAGELSRRWAEGIGSRGVASVAGFDSIVEFEATSMECSSASTSSFATHLILDMTGISTDMTPRQNRDLERMAVKLYNQMNVLNKNTCDPSQRIVQDAKLSVYDNRLPQSPYGEVVTTVNASPQIPTDSMKPYSIVLTLTGTCQDCRDDQPLFDVSQDTSRALKQDQTPTLSSESRFLQDIDEDLLSNLDCLCPMGATEVRGPTSSEFLKKLVDSVQQDRAMSSSSAIIEEMREDSCVRGDNFVMYMTIELESPVSEKVALAMADVVMKMYNKNSVNVCDPEGKIMTDAFYMDNDMVRKEIEMLMDENASRVPSANPSSAPSYVPSAKPSGAPSMVAPLPTPSPTSEPTEVPFLIALTFKITGVCAGCNSDETEMLLFDDANVWTGEIARRNRDLQQSGSGSVSVEAIDACSCPFDESLPEMGAPMDAFKEDMDGAIADNLEVLGGVVISKITVSEVPPLPATLAPTMGSSFFPSAPVSPQPSFSPSFTPTPRPSPSPSTTPSAVPTISPTMKPSPIPTRAPSPFPTYENCCRPLWRECFTPSGKQEECCDGARCVGDVFSAICEPAQGAEECSIVSGSCNFSTCCPGGECVVINEFDKRCNEVCIPIT